MNPLENFLNELELLIGLLDVSDKPVYELIKDHKHSHLEISLDQLFNHSSENYSNLIIKSAFILGLSYFEDFLGRCITQILTQHPEKNDLRVTLNIIHDKGANLISYAAEEQSRKMPFSEKILFLERNLSGVDNQLLNRLKFVYNIRNCIMHNNGKADTTIVSKYNLHQKILLTREDINEYGLLVRYTSGDVWNRMAVLYPSELK